jgi:hypothetical protein
MKKNVNYVDAIRFEKVWKKLHLNALEQAGFVKVSSGKNGRQVYVARTKRVGRVDISNFLSKDPGVRNLDVLESFGAVKQQIDFSRTEGEILATFEAVLKEMKDLPPAEKKARPAPMATTKKSKTARANAIKARAEAMKAAAEHAAPGTTDVPPAPASSDASSPAPSAEAAPAA